MKINTWVDALFRGLRESLYGALALLFFVLFLCSMWVYVHGVQLRAWAEFAITWVSVFLVIRFLVLWSMIRWGPRRSNDE